jgi:hypothetical protein
MLFLTVFPKTLTIRKYLIFIFIIVINTLQATSPLVALFHWLKVFECIALVYILTARHNLFSQISKPLSLAVIVTAVLAIWQLLLGSSVGGFWRLLGERPLSVNTPGIAKVIIFNQTFLRPYSTLPHPNALAGFALLALVLLLYLHSINVLSQLAKFLCVILVVISFSRSAIFALALLPLFIKKMPRLPKIIYLTMLFMFTVILYTSGQPSSTAQRWQYIVAFFQLFKNHYLLGVGLGNFITAAALQSLLPFSTFQTLYSPVHNVFLLAIVELGVFPVLVIAFLLKNVFKQMFLAVKNNALLSYGLIALLITGLLDNYWITLQQNVLLLTIFFTLLVVKFKTT